MFPLITLPYSLTALEPVISVRTLEFHHGKHLQGYVDNLNKLLPGSPFEAMGLEEIVAKADGAIFNNAGQILNHNLYFTQFRPVAAPEAVADGEPLAPNQPNEDSPLFKRIVLQWGSFEAFQAEFVAKGVGLFGSGWVWLSAREDGSLVITQEPGAGNPVTKGLRPLLTFDVWEHAYYLDYQNRRPAHLAELWKIVDWEVIDKRYSIPSSGHFYQWLSKGG